MAVQAEMQHIRSRLLLRGDGQFGERAVKETALEVKIRERDLRAKTASDAESLDRAQQTLGHADASTTKWIYRRKPERVKPLK
ncbi:MAG: hypothetical protein JJT90_18780 [Ectothiorhodospiraceae bacterium]|nr:hypothetical protein [Ectothiorhodospiraceae bacterium]